MGIFTNCFALVRTNSSWKTKGLIWAPIIARYALWNLMIFMTDYWDFSSAKAAAYVNLFWGITAMLQIVMKFLLDAFGNFRMALFFGSAYSIGLGLLSASVRMNEKNLYFPIALVALSLGISCGESISFDKLTQQGDNDLAREGDTELAREEDRDIAREGDREEDRDIARGGDSALAIEEGIDLAREGDSELVIEEARDIARGGDREEDRDLARGGDSELATEEDTKYLARFGSSASKFFRQHKNKFILALIHVVGVVILYFTDYKILFLISALCMLAATLVFATFKPVQARGSHPTTAFMDAYSRFKNILKCRSCLTNNGNGEEQQRNGRSERGRPAAMRKRRFLVCMAFFMLGVVSAVGDTYFLDQADAMNSMHGPRIFILQLWYYFARFIFSTAYTEIVKRIDNTDLKKYAGCAGLSVSMFLAILCCFTAAEVEAERLDRVRSNRVVPHKNVTDMTTFWMVPQYTLLGGLDGISRESIDLLFSNDSPERMDPYLNHLTTGVHGLGNIGNVLAVFIMGKASAWRDGTSWFQDTLDKSRLDKYYWSLAAVSIANFVFYTIVYYWHDLRNHVSVRLGIVSSNTQGREAADHVP